MMRKSKAPPFRGHEEATEEGLRNDPEFAAEYLNAVLEDGDQEELLLALRRLAKAFGGLTRVAGSAELNAKSLYRTLSPHGNPELRSLRALLKAMGMRLAVRPVCARSPRRARAAVSTSH
jgi:probable addiction module antidote protein